jgi:phosphate transport system substrate-binding protein
MFIAADRFQLSIHIRKESMRIKSSSKIVAILASLFLSASLATPAQAVDLQGSGASFVDPLLQACKAGFAQKTPHSYVYTSTGSGTGKKNSDAKVGDFWFSDSAHTGSTKRSTIFHAPIVAAPIAVLVNLPARKDIYLSPTTVAKIFSGEITKWNDPEIVKDNNRSVTVTVLRKDRNGNVVLDKNGNPRILRTSKKNIYYTLPNQPIKVIFRSDTSGTSNNFTTWLNGVAPEIWTKKGNDAFTTAFPGNINAVENIGRIVGANQSQGVATLAQKTKYSITYAEKNWGDAYGLRSAYIGNAAGDFTSPNSAATSAFLAQAKQAADGVVTYDYNTKTKGVYTLGIVSYMLLETSYADKARGAAVVDLAKYILSSDCSGKDPALGFIVIQGDYLKKAEELIARANK